MKLVKIKCQISPSHPHKSLHPLTNKNAQSVTGRTAAPSTHSVRFTSAHWPLPTACKWVWWRARLTRNVFLTLCRSPRVSSFCAGRGRALRHNLLPIGCCFVCPLLSKVWVPSARCYVLVCFVLFVIVRVLDGMIEVRWICSGFSFSLMCVRWKLRAYNYWHNYIFHFLNQKFWKQTGILGFDSRNG